MKDVEKKEGVGAIERGHHSVDAESPTTPEDAALVLQTRVDLFNKELTRLLEEHKLGLGGEPFIHGGMIYAKAVIVDVK